MASDAGPVRTMVCASSPPIQRTRHGSSATTVYGLMPSLRMAASPKDSPAPRRSISASPALTTTSPEKTIPIPSARAPARSNSVPARTSSGTKSGAMRAMLSASKPWKSAGRARTGSRRVDGTRATRTPSMGGAAGALPALASAAPLRPLGWMSATCLPAGAIAGNDGTESIRRSDCS
jgi:hypothetical protein